MGGPSAAIVLYELIALGARRAIRVGTCGALDPALELGDLVVAREAIAADGTSTALSDQRQIAASADEGAADRPGRTQAHAQLAEQLGHITGAGDRPAHLDATIVSTDLFYEADAERSERWRREGAIAVEMEASALFAVGEREGIEVACLLAVSDTFDADGKRTHIDDHELLAASEAMGRAATAALSDR
jgi:uridine phosphorylase